MSGRGPSIQTRLTWRLGTLFVVMLLIGAVGLFLHFRTAGDELPIGPLRDDLDTVAAALSMQPDGTVGLDFAGHPPSGFDYLVARPDGRELFISRPEARDLFDPIPAGWTVGVFRNADADADMDIVGGYSVIDLFPDSVVVQVAERESGVGRAWRDAAKEWVDDLLPVLTPFLLATLVIAGVTIRGGLAPLRTAARRAAAIAPNATDVRLPEDGLPREVRPLVHAVNAALERLDTGFRHQRDFTADAAHELRTPLATLAAHLDALEDRGGAAALRADVDRMAHLVDQMLAIARLEALAVAPNERADLHAIAVDVAASLAPLALKRRRGVEVVGVDGPVIVRGNAEALRQAVRNLVENGLRFTPEDTTVSIAVGTEPALRVSDRGPGIPPARRADALRRFWRADRGRGEGSGLGLAIVARIVAAHGGRVEIDDAPGGGTQVALFLPGG